MSEEQLPPFPSPLPMFAVHLASLGVHVLAGVSLALFLALGPALHPLEGEPMTSTRYWLAGIAGFSTLVTVVFSSIVMLASLRLISIFLLKRPTGLIRATMLVAVVLAHVVGCATGIVGSGVAVFGTVFGEHGGPWTEKP
ncbi:MAG: hypothetical protein KC656_20615 [Myxococcales bacterium]|nr:hypothetical protein [Myxococcales bacterium]